ncbi:hypothetical protein HDU89_006959 [Geranomyces variabilis]|nr:hypothetical protein HDU89_006959 [Geranomyces variabilis]
MTVALDIHERNIDPTYLVINLPPTPAFFKTVKALYIIRDHKLYKLRRFKSFEKYLAQKWNLSRTVGNRLCVAGRVIHDLEKVFPEDQLPSNVTLCNAVDAWAKKRHETLATVWKAALNHFDGRSSVVASQFADIYEEEPRVDSAIDLDDDFQEQQARDEAPQEVEEAEEEESTDSSEGGFTRWIDSLDDSDPMPESRRSASKRTISYVEPASSSDDESDHNATPSASPPVRKQKRSFFKSGNVYNTPQWMCDLIQSFTGGIGLDPCSNPRSNVLANKKYGYQEDGSFVNALALQDWDNTDWVYLNPPGVATNENERTHGHNLNAPFWKKCLEELEKGNIKRVIALVPQRSYGPWNAEVITKALVCFLRVSVGFDYTKEDGRQSSNSDIYSRSLYYLDTDESYPYAKRFVETFGKYGYIPGVSMRVYKVPNDDRHIRYFSLCAGIGTAELAIQSVFRNATCVGFSEIDPAALAVYQQHFPHHLNYGDALTIDIDSLPDFDLLIGGIPCQPFSRQSNGRTNFGDERSKLFDVFVQILESKSPQHFLLENVPMSPIPRKVITDQLNVTPVELNSSFWTAQNRKRLYWCNWYIPLPVRRPSPKLVDIIDVNAGDFVTSYKDLPSNPPTDCICSVARNTATGKVDFRKDGKALTLVTADCYQTIVLVNGRYRHYTVEERELLQGFPEGYTEVAGVGSAERKRLLSNAMTLPVVEYALKHI